MLTHLANGKPVSGEECMPESRVQVPPNPLRAETHPASHTGRDPSATVARQSKIP